MQEQVPKYNNPNDVWKAVKDLQFRKEDTDNSAIDIKFIDKYGAELHRSHIIPQNQLKAYFKEMFKAIDENAETPRFPVTAINKLKLYLESGFFKKITEDLIQTEGGSVIGNFKTYIQQALIWNPGNITAAIHDVNRVKGPFENFDKEAYDSLKDRKSLLEDILYWIKKPDPKKYKNFEKFMDLYNSLANQGYGIMKWEKVGDKFKITGSKMQLTYLRFLTDKNCKKQLKENNKIELVYQDMDLVYGQKVRLQNQRNKNQLMQQLQNIPSSSSPNRRRHSHEIIKQLLMEDQVNEDGESTGSVEKEDAKDQDDDNKKRAPDTENPNKDDKPTENNNIQKYKLKVYLPNREVYWLQYSKEDDLLVAQLRTALTEESLMNERQRFYFQENEPFAAKGERTSKVLDHIILENGIGKIAVGYPKSMKEIEEDLNMDKQIQKINKYKEIFGELDEEQFKDADMKQKKHIHPTLQDNKFIEQMIQEQTESSKGKGLYDLKDDEIFSLLKKTGYLYGKIISSSEFEERPLKPFFLDSTNAVDLTSIPEDSIFNCCEAFINVKECDNLLSKILSISGIQEKQFSAKVPYVAKAMANSSSKTEQNSSESQQKSSMYAEYNFPHGVINLERIRNLVNPEVQEFFNHREINVKNVDKFLRTFGDIISIQVTYGGKMYVSMNIQDYLAENSRDKTNELKVKAQARCEIMGAFVDVGAGYHSANREQESSKTQERNQNKNLRCKGGNSMYIATPNKWITSLQDSWKFWEVIGINHFKPTYKYIQNKEHRRAVKATLDFIAGKKDEEKFKDEEKLQKELRYKIDNQVYLDYNQIVVRNRNGSARSAVCLVKNTSEYDYQFKDSNATHGCTFFYSRKLGLTLPSLLKKGSSYIFETSSEGIMTGCEAEWVYKQDGGDQNELRIHLTCTYWEKECTFVITLNGVKVKAQKAIESVEGNLCIIAYLEIPQPQSGKEFKIFGIMKNQENEVNEENKEWKKQKDQFIR